MRLPNSDDALITEAKLAGYLLNPSGRDPTKARLFAALGYTQENWSLMERDIREQILALEGQEVEPNAFGRKWEIIGLLRGPLGSANIITVWMIEHGTSQPRLITAYRA